MAGGIAPCQLAAVLCYTFTVQHEVHAALPTIKFFSEWDRNSTWDHHGQSWAESTGHVHSSGDDRYFYVAKQVASNEEVHRILSESRRHAGDFMLERDSIDQLPLYEQNIIRRRKADPKFESLASEVLWPLISDRLEPYVREKFQCPGCVMCTALLRRYRVYERLLVPAHTDLEAYATVLLALNPSEYLGGLYLTFPSDIQRADERHFLSLESGDVVLHRWDLSHGVRVFNGTRYSLFFWFNDDEDSCKSGRHTAWFERAVADGDAGAAASLANILAINFTGSEWQMSNAAAGTTVPLVKQAAKGNSMDGMYWWAQMHYDGMLVKKSMKKARRWYRKAAALGHVTAQVVLARLCLLGKGGPKDEQQALMWLHKAADHDSVHAIMFLARLHLGVMNLLPVDLDAHWKMVRRAAELGHGEAIKKLRAHVGDISLDGDADARALQHGSEL